MAVEQYLAFTRMREVRSWGAGAQAEPAGAAELSVNAADTSEWSPPATLVAGPIDINDARLFLAGDWTPLTSRVEGFYGRVATGGGSIAGFECHEGRLSLTFAQGPHCADAIVRIGEHDHRVTLSNPASPGSLKTVEFNLSPGRHHVFIRPSDRVPGQDSSLSLTWFGGSAAPTTNLQFVTDPALEDYRGEVSRYGTRKGRIAAVELLDWRSARPVTELTFGQRVRLRLHAERLAPAGPRLEFSFIVRDRNRIDLFGTTTIDEGVRLDERAARFTVEFAFDVSLGPGSYSILVAFVECSEDLTSRVPMDQIDIAKVFTVSFDPTRPVWYVYNEPVTTTAAVFDAEEHDADER